MKLIPEIKLPDDLQLNADPDVYEFIESCLSGIKYISIHKKEKRGKYEPVSKIELQDKPGINQRPVDKIDDICRIVMGIIQYDIEARDESGTYRIQIFRNTGTTKDAVKAKHVDIKLDERNIHSHDHTTDPFNDDENLSFNSIQLEYIKMLQDQNIKNQSIVTGIVSALTDNMKNLQGMVNDLMTRNVEIERLRAQERLLEREKDIESQLEKLRQENKTERWNKAMDLLKHSGGAKRIFDVVADKIKGKAFDDAVELPDEEMIPKKQQKRQTPSTAQRQTPSQPQSPRQPQRSSIPPEELAKLEPDYDDDEDDDVEDEEKNQDKIDQEINEEIDEMIKNQPLRCRVNVLGARLTDEQREELKKVFGDFLYNIFDALLNSDSEETARQNLLTLQGSITPKDLPKLKKAKNLLDDKQKELVDEILMFDVGGEE